MRAGEIREMSAEELAQRLEETEKELFNLYMQQSSGQLEKPSRIKDIRRDIARIKTILREAEVGQS